jgi:hypothetical protein
MKLKKQEKNQIEYKYLFLKINFKSSLNFKKASFLNEFIIFFNYNKLQGKKINHIHRFVGPITTNTNIIRPIFDHQNEAIQIVIT